MELKNYQKTVMQDLARFIAAVNREGNIVKGWESYWQDKDINVGANGALSYKNKIKNTPCVCLKVPTGGGKTFMACCAVKKIFAAMPPQKPKLLVWLVPSDPILQQTLRTCRMLATLTAGVWTGILADVWAFIPRICCLAGKTFPRIL